MGTQTSNKNKLKKKTYCWNEGGGIGPSYYSTSQASAADDGVTKIIAHKIIRHQINCRNNLSCAWEREWPGARMENVLQIVRVN